MQFFRREIAGPIVGDEDALLHEDHIFKNFFLLSLIKNGFVGRAQRVGVNFIETGAHLIVTGDCLHAVNRFQIGSFGRFTALEVKQGGGFEGKHGVGRHESVRQRDLGVSRERVVHDFRAHPERLDQSFGAQILVRTDLGCGGTVACFHGIVA